ncbi:MAG TPA: hypothetical protein VLW50_03255 [Streptosporangiaceae bacterium]|nr:hypothetical protein [Streptosporangiaceae bacterium]
MSATSPRTVTFAYWLAGALAVASLAGCSGAVAQSVSSGKPNVLPSPRPSLCERMGVLSRLVVDRTNTLQDNRIRYRFAGTVTVSEPNHVQTAARALCALPHFPAGSFACPADTGTVYALRFSARGRRLPTVAAQATGCEVVRGLGAPRWTSTTPGFWYTLGEVMGVRNPGRTAFAGTVPAN